MIPHGNYKYTIQYSDCRLHGEDVGGSSDWPEISADFYIQFWRDDPNDTTKLKWDTSSWDWSYDNGHFGYKIHAAIAINPANKYWPDWDTELFTILEKTHTGDDGNDWWSYASHAGTASLPAPGPRYVTSTSNTAKLCIYVAERDCMHLEGGSYVYCFDDDRDWYLVGEIDLDVPPYSTPYTVSYVTQDVTTGRSGTPVSAQTEYTPNNLQLSATRPTLPIYITYHFDTTQSISVNKYFNNWKCDYDSAIYAPSSIYPGQTTTTMRAQWGPATFTPLAIPNKYFTLSYNTNGGNSISSTSLLRDTNGYATSSGSTTKAYTPGVSSSTATDLNLYPIYQTATVVSGNLPTPTRSGFRFDGWYKDSALTQKITSNYTISSNVTIYAKWIALPLYQINNYGNWGTTGPYVWQVGDDHQWHKVAHVYQVDNNHTWKDISEG